MAKTNTADKSVKVAKQAKTAKPIEVAAQELEENHAAISISFSWLGMTRSLNTSQKEEAAAIFQASRDSMAMSKRLFDTSHPSFKKLGALKTIITNFWKMNSLPYPEDSVRLFRKDDVPAIISKFEELRSQFDETVKELNSCYDALIVQTKERLGALFNPADYPSHLLDSFSFSWDFKNVSPPSYLMHLNPALYAEEQAKMQARFSEAVRLAEAAFRDELAKLVTHLSEKLAGRDDDGKRMIFHASTVTNLNEFFGKFQKLNIGSNSQLEKLVEDAKKLVEGVDPVTLRTDYDLRDKIATGMENVKNQLDGLTVAAPRRKVVRGGYAPSPSPSL